MVWVKESVGKLIHLALKWFPYFCVSPFKPTSPRFVALDLRDNSTYRPMPKHNIRIVLFAIILLASCKSIKPDNPPTPTLPGPPFATSSINIPIEIPLTQIEGRLNAVPVSKLFQDQGLSLGSGLTADVDVDRNGPIKLQGLDNSNLQVRMPMKVRGSLKIEKKVFGQVLSTSIPFDESISPQFRFQPAIGENWDIQIKDLQIDNWGRSLRYNLLGFEIDLEPLIERQVQRVLDNQMLASNLIQLDFRHTAQETWDMFAGSHSMELDGFHAYLSTQPESIHVSQEFGADQVLRLYVGLEGAIDAGIGNAPKVVKKPLPSISPNDRKDNGLDVKIPVVIPFPELDSYLNRQFSGQTLRLDSKTTLVPSNLHTSQYGDKTLLSMDFKAVRKDKKEISGKMYFAGIADYDSDAKTIQLTKPQFDVKSDDFFSNLAMRLKRAKIQRQIRKVASFPIGGILADAPNTLQQMLRLDLGFGTMKVEESALDVIGIFQTENDIRLYLQGSGKVQVDINK